MHQPGYVREWLSSRDYQVSNTHTQKTQKNSVLKSLRGIACRWWYLVRCRNEVVEYLLDARQRAHAVVIVVVKLAQHTVRQALCHKPGQSDRRIHILGSVPHLDLVVAHVFQSKSPIVRQEQRLVHSRPRTLRKALKSNLKQALPRLSRSSRLFPGVARFLCSPFSLLLLFHLLNPLQPRIEPPRHRTQSNKPAAQAEKPDSNQRKRSGEVPRPENQDARGSPHALSAGRRPRTRRGQEPHAREHGRRQVARASQGVR